MKMLASLSMVLLLTALTIVMYSCHDEPAVEELAIVKLHEGLHKVSLRESTQSIWMYSAKGKLSGVIVYDTLHKTKDELLYVKMSRDGRTVSRIIVGQYQYVYDSLGVVIRTQKYDGGWRDLDSSNDKGESVR